MSWNLTTESCAISKAGVHANATIVTPANIIIARWADDAEASVEQMTNTSWVANLATLSSPMLAALSDTVSSMVAMNMIAYDPTGYLTREADMLMNWNDDKVNKGIAALKGKPDTLKAP